MRSQLEACLVYQVLHPADRYAEALANLTVAKVFTVWMCVGQDENVSFLFGQNGALSSHAAQSDDYWCDLTNFRRLDLVKLMVDRH